MKILLVEDDERTASYVKKGAQELGHVVDHAKGLPPWLICELREALESWEAANGR